MSAGSEIDRVESWAVRVELERPLQLGALLIPSRDFIVVRITTRDGVTGVAYSLTRGAPVDVVVGEMLGPVLLGGSALETAERTAACRQAYFSLGDVGLFGQGLSLVDICLWDIRAKSEGLPLWRLLGGASTRAPVMLVAPHPRPGEPEEAYVERIALAARPGYRMLKIYPTARPSDMVGRLTALRDVFGSEKRFVVDMSWVWQYAADAIPIVHQWAPFDLEWVEDPIPAERPNELKLLSDALTTPVAVGDEVTVRSYVQAILDIGAVDLLRLDASTIGGISGFSEVRQRAERAGLRISPHVYPEFHRHCVFAWPDVGPIETFAVPCDTWGSHRFVPGDAAAVDAEGYATAPQAPGLGYEVDWDAVRSLSRRYNDVRPGVTV